MKSSAAESVLTPEFRHWRWRIFGITWLAYAGLYLTRKSFSVAKIDMGRPETLALSKTDMAWIDGAFLLAYAIGQFAFGMCGDRFGARRVILWGMASSILVAVAMGMVSTSIFPAPLADGLSRVFGVFSVGLMTGTLGSLFFVQGLAQSTGWAPLSKNISSFFLRHERGRIMGMWCTNYALGGLLASAFAGYLGQKYGWRAAFIGPALGLCVILVLFAALQRNQPEDAGLPTLDESLPSESVGYGQTTLAAKPAETGSWSVVLETIRNPVVLVLCLVYFCLKPARYAILFWGPKYIHDRLGSGMAQSGLLSGLFEAAGPVSVFAAGWISDRWFGARRMPVAVMCLGLLSIVLFTIDKLPHTAWALGSALFVIGFLTFAPDSLVSGTAAIDFGSKRGASTASGLINGSGSIGAIVGGTLPGVVEQRGGWSAVFALLAGSVLLAAVLLLPKWNAVPNRKD